MPDQKRAHTGGAPLWAAAAVLAAAACWSTIGVTYRLILDEYDVDPVTIVALRATTAGLVLLGYTLRTRTRTAAFGTLFTRPLLPVTLSIGLISTSVFYVALIYAYEDAGVAVGTVLLYFAPSLVALGAWLFFRQRLTARQLAALVMALAGITGVSGIISGAVMLVWRGSYWVCSRRAGTHRTAYSDTICCVPRPAALVSSRPVSASAH